MDRLSILTLLLFAFTISSPCKVQAAHWPQQELTTLSDDEDSLTDEDELAVDATDEFKNVEVVGISVYNTIEEAEAAMAAMLAGIEISEEEELPEQEEVIEVEEPLDIRQITFFDETVAFEIHKSMLDFPCIVIRLSDKNANQSLGTCLEIKKQDEFYLLKVKYDPKKYRTLDKGVEEYLKELFKRFYEDKKYTQKVWSAFVKEGALQLFIDTTHEFIDGDEEFLALPFDEIYG